MSETMRCDEYLARLTAAVESDRPPSDGERTALAAHAARCEACGGTEALLGELARPAADRDRRDDPGPAYWAEFSERLSARLERRPADDQPPAPADGRIARRLPRRALAVAALLVVGLLGWAVLRAPSDPVPIEQVRASVEPIEPTEPIDELSWVAGWGGPWEPANETAALFPELDGLDPEGRAELLDWLEGDDDAS